MNTRMRNSTVKLCIAALFITLGILVPQLFHMIGGATMGGIFLPMHLPVLIAGLFLGPYYGGLVGVITPILSFFFTGMPPAAKLPFMVIELAAYGGLSGFFQMKSNHCYRNLILAQIGGRIVNAIGLFLAAHLLHMQVSAVFSVVTAFISGLPGIVLQLVIVPPAVILLKKVIHFDMGLETS